jgi:hypothetical protein
MTTKLSFRQTKLIEKYITFLQQLGVECQNQVLFSEKKLKFLPIGIVKFSFKDENIEAECKELPGKVTPTYCVTLSGPVKIITSFLEHIQKDENETDLYQYESGRWMGYGKVPDRTLDTIYFDSKKRVIADFKIHMSSNVNQMYKRTRVRRRRIYVFHGLAKTGRTSFIYALARQNEWHVAVIKDYHNMGFMDLQSCLNKLDDKTIVVFENLNTIPHNLTHRMILDAITSVSTDLIVVFKCTGADTSLEKMADMSVHFTYATKTQVVEMFLQFFPDLKTDVVDFFDMVKDKKFVTGDLERYFLNCIYSEKSPIENILAFDIRCQKLIRNQMYL